MSQVLRLNDRNFEQEVCHAETPVLVEFWASWCPPCKMAEPVLDELSRECDGNIKIGKLNVDQNPRTGSRYQIKGVPTFILFNSGKPVRQKVGAQSKDQLKRLVVPGTER